MTHQQMIDYWEKEIQKHESAQKFLSSTLQIDRHRALEMQARIIHLQLCSMVFDKSIISTSTNYKAPQFPPDRIEPEFRGWWPFRRKV